MSEIRIIDDLDGDPVVPFHRREIGDVWRSDAHVLIVLPGDGDGPEYAMAHPSGCDHDCAVEWNLREGGYEQPPGYPQIPTDPGLYLIRLETVKGGWVNGSFAVEHDCYLVDDEIGGANDD